MPWICSVTGSASTSITAGSATHFAVTAPSAVTAGTTSGITVTALDAFGNTATASSACNSPGRRVVIESFLEATFTTSTVGCAGAA